MSVDAIRLPGKLKEATAFSIPTVESRIPTPDEFVVLSPALLKATAKIGETLKACRNNWAIGGDVGELMLGVNVNPDRVTILTTKNGCNEISGKLANYQVESPKVMESELERRADIASNSYPARIKSYAASFSFDGTRLEVLGDLQIKISEWEWGDPLEFEPEVANVVGVMVPVVPLRLKKELYSGLGWTDRVKKINGALIRRHHRIGSTVLR